MKKNAIAWLEALISGKYKQGKDALGDEKGGFCCWGLGCFITKTPYESYHSWNGNLASKIGFITDKGKGELLTEFYGRGNLIEINDETTAGFKRIGKFLIKTADLHFKPIVAKAIKEHFNK